MHNLNEAQGQTPVQGAGVLHHLHSSKAVKRFLRPETSSHVSMQHQQQHFVLMQVVLAPVILGAALNQTFPKAVKQTAPFAPLVAVAAVVLIVASVIAQNAAAVTLAGPKLIAAIISLHSGRSCRQL